MTDKQNKMHPIEVKLPRCPECGRHTLIIQKMFMGSATDYCLSCKYQNTRYEAEKRPDSKSDV